MIEIGRMIVKIAGRDSRKTGVVVDIIDDNTVMIDGEVRRRKCNIKHIEPLDKVLDIKKGADHGLVVEVLSKEGITIASKKPKDKTERPKKVRKAKEKPEAKPKVEAKKEKPKAEVKPEAKPKAKPKVAKAEKPKVAPQEAKAEKPKAKPEAKPKEAKPKVEKKDEDKPAKSE